MRGNRSQDASRFPRPEPGGAALQKWGVECRFREWNEHFSFQIFYI